MKKQIINYKIYLMGRDKDNFEYVSMFQGMKIIMALSSENPPKFIKVGDNLINTSSISSISQEKFEWNEEPAIRELTQEEEKILLTFENSNIKLLK